MYQGESYWTWKLFYLAAFSSSVMQALFVQAFLFYPKDHRVCLLLRLAKFYLLKFPVQPGVKQLAKSSQPAAVMWYFWRKSWMGPARELQAAAWINPSCSSGRLSCLSTLCWAAGQELQDRHSPCPEQPAGTVGIPDQYMPSFPEKGLSVLWRSLLSHHSFPGSEVSEKRGLNNPLALNPFNCFILPSNIESEQATYWHPMCLCYW